MENSKLMGWDTHGFHTMQDLDVGSIMNEAKARWLRPNEIHAILCNYSYFSINVKPFDLPKGGTIILFDRKKLRNFRKDGHNWKKKKDGKTVKEAHEHLKVGNEEKIHVYYAHGEDNPTFVRRCYWLLDKALEHIVLVHYRETRELVSKQAGFFVVPKKARIIHFKASSFSGQKIQISLPFKLVNQIQSHFLSKKGTAVLKRCNQTRPYSSFIFSELGTPTTPGYSNSSPGLSEPSIILSDEADSVRDPVLYTHEKSELESGNIMTLKSHEMRLHEINNLEWEELVVPDDPNKFSTPDGELSWADQQDQFETYTTLYNGDVLPIGKSPPPSKNSAMIPSDSLYLSNSLQNALDNLGYQRMENQTDSDVHRKNPSNIMSENVLQTQESFGRWLNYVNSVAPEPLQTSNPSLPSADLQSSNFGQIFSITDISPEWAFAAEEAKILITGLFYKGYPDLGKSNLYCVCGDSCNPVAIVQPGVFRCYVSSHKPGLVNLFLSFDGRNPISQVINFEYRTHPSKNKTISDAEDLEREEFRVRTRLVHLLFSTSKVLTTLSNKISPNALKEGKIFEHKTSQIADEWASLVHSVKNDQISTGHDIEDLFKLTLKNRLIEWLLERVVRGGKILEFDDEGQGVIHLCAMLNYSWAVYPFKLSGLSLDYRDKFGWTALHWAAYCGRENMVAALLSAGAKPNLVTDPNSENPSGCIAADLASNNGHDGLSAYLAEKALVAHFEDMKLAGNVSGSLQTENRFELTNPENLTEEELYLKDTLAAYRTAADAAGRIQTAFREHSFKLRTQAVEESSPEDEVRSIVAAMKIQHAYRKYETRKHMAAAARIQHRFRTWKIRKDFLNMRRQAVRIQAVFRAFQVRRNYRKIVWSVGILEKAILRWRLRKKGFRGLQVSSMDTVEEDKPKENGDVEDFFRAGRKQAEDRTVRAVVRVQAMFRSKQAQQEYRRMKLTHNAALLEYEGLVSPNIGMGECT